MGVISWKDCGQQVALPPTSTTPHAKQGQPHSQEVKFLPPEWGLGG